MVDLTHTMSPSFPTFFGVPGIEIQQRYNLENAGFNLNWWHLNEHSGTHLDAPFHYFDDGAPVEKLAIETLVVPFGIVDVTTKASQDPDYLLSRQDLFEWEDKLGRFPDNCCVAMQSGWAQYVTDPAKFSGQDPQGGFHFPGIGPDAAEWLLEQRRISGIAVDTMSLDSGQSKDFGTHQLWLQSGRWGLENVANLNKVPASGATLVVGVAKIQGATGAPARLLALV